MKTLNEIAENYFNTLNPIAERISADILAIKDAYEGLWHCLSSKEKNQIINETVVHPEVVLKYNLSTGSCNGVNFDIPLINKEVTGSKYIVDETTGLTWRDEHSGPFSWKTPSQIDLSIFPKGEFETTIEDTFYPQTKKECGNLNFPETLSTLLNKENGNSFEKNGNKNGITPLPQSAILVGSCSRFSGFCSKFKFLPGKSYSYEVQTVISNPNASNDGSFFNKLKATAVLKLQNSLKLVGGKSAEKKAEDTKEMENLVHLKNTASILKLQKPSPKIAKPKSPPPPPPVLKTEQDNNDNNGSKNLILVRNSKNLNSGFDKDSETATLLGENSVQSFLSADADSLEQDLQNKVTPELSDDYNSINTESTPLSGPYADVIPKSGFDFLDNW